MDGALSVTGDGIIGRDGTGARVAESGKVLNQRQFPALQDGFGLPPFHSGPAGDLLHDPVDPVAFPDLADKGGIALGVRLQRGGQQDEDADKGSTT